MLALTPVFRPKEDIAAVAHLYGQGWSLARLCYPRSGLKRIQRRREGVLPWQELQFRYGDVRSPSGDPTVAKIGGSGICITAQWSASITPRSSSIISKWAN